MKKYILFDLDGTLTDPKIGITTSVQYALDSFGIHVENLDDLTCFIGPPLLDSFQEYYHFTLEQAQQAVVKFRERFGVKGKFENQVLSWNPPNAGTFAAVREGAGGSNLQAGNLCGGDSGAF